MIDHVLSYLRKQSDAPVLVDDYCNLNYGMTWRDLQRSENAEWYAEVLHLIESGDLKLETVGTRNIQ
jgi:hypothetical protein